MKQESFATRIAVFALMTLGCGAAASHGVPAYRVDIVRPQLPLNDWILGQVSGVAADADDHVWVLRRPASQSDDECGATTFPRMSTCCTTALAVPEFEASGKPLRACGGPGNGYDWPGNEHGIHVDHKGFD